MSADIIAWLRSPEGEEWSRERTKRSTGAGVAPWRTLEPAVLEDDPCGRPPLSTKDAATEGAA